MTWDEHFLKMAQLVAQRSKDPSTKTGAVIVDQDNRVISTGYNGFPSKMPDHQPWLDDREQKYSRIVHCEMNALIFAKQDLTWCTLYTWPFMSCDRCAVCMLQAGITRFVAPRNDAERWVEAFAKTRSYIQQCGCTLVEYDQ